ncbi:MAG: carbohydrate ABC transporter permease [Clostridiales bacterium]|nr:carbohydrate ABC transporter permease [Clostridiales bacterium]
MAKTKTMTSEDLAFDAKNKIKKSTGDKVMSVFFYVFITVFAVACVLPLVVVLSASLTDETTLNTLGYSLIPRKFSLDAYKLVATAGDFGGAYLITIFTTVVGTLMSMFLTCTAAYALSVKNFRCRSYLALFIYFTMLFNGGLVSNYLLIKNTLHLNNTIWVLLLPSLCNAWNILLMRNFFNGIPDSLAESAKIDGANDMTILARIILPISKPGLATVGLFYALSYWNEWYRCLLYVDTSHSELYTLQYLIQRILRQVNYAANLPSEAAALSGALPTYSFRMAAVIVTIGPIILLYPFLQKYFVKGLTVGSVKG